ncbi:hypothetical protein CEXT_216341 [Caerostris extrusa]|uniref:Uncharacterized protein n=1 Tax=Caerostris extrusa TaxID=172846 RepID=A0AAV4Y419_CAEEX|nr:hypothetical protein CEXT_216341 [Caerostris extrusa]
MSHLERRAKKRQQTSKEQTSNPSSSKRRRLDNKSSASMYYYDLLSYPQAPWDKANNDFFKSIRDGPAHRCICCDRLMVPSIHDSAVKVETPN